MGTGGSKLKLCTCRRRCTGGTQPSDNAAKLLTELRAELRAELWAELRAEVVAEVRAEVHLRKQLKEEVLNEIVQESQAQSSAPRSAPLTGQYSASSSSSSQPATSSSSAVTAQVVPTAPPLCHCRVAARIQIVKAATDNKGRRLYVCRDGRCSQWIGWDPDEQRNAAGKWGDESGTRISPSMFVQDPCVCVREGLCGCSSGNCAQRPLLHSSDVANPQDVTGGLIPT
jgi:hypothetical protein